MNNLVNIEQLNNIAVNFIGIAVKFIAPLLVLWIIIRCARSLLGWKCDTEVWAKLKMPDGSFLPLTHWENLIGRAKACDVVLNVASVSRNHAVITRKNEKRWAVTDLNSKSGVTVNGVTVEGTDYLTYGDVINIGGVNLKLCKEEDREAAPRFPSKFSAAVTFLIISVFQILSSLVLFVNSDSENKHYILIVFLGLLVIMWLYFGLVSLSRRKGFEIEALAFMLCTIGLCATASVDCSALPKQFIAIIAGLVLFVFLCIMLRYYEFSKKWRWFVAPLGIVLLVITYLFADTINGAKNWIYIGSVSIQPSELAKIAFIYAGTATLERLLSKRNIILFAVFSVCCMGMLALMNDFGTAAVFFVTFVVIAFLRSGDFSTLVLSGAGIGLAGFLVLRFKPYVLDRFKAWRNVWDYAYDLGYQQTRTLMCIASGGLWGVGACRGNLRYVSAADTDLVFGLLSEEWGLIIALCAIAVLIVFAVFTYKVASVGRSSFYIIAACAATSIFCFQAILNVFGSVDILPLTGVTFPFVSNGGSSMLASWGLLAFIKAADVRSNASFAAVSLYRAKRGAAK